MPSKIPFVVLKCWVNPTASKCSKPILERHLSLSVLEKTSIIVEACMLLFGNDCFISFEVSQGV